MTTNLAAQGVRFGVYCGVIGLGIAAGWVAVRASSAAPERTCKVELSAQVKVSEVLDGGAMRLADGRRVLLSGVDVPRSNAKSGNSRLAAEARAKLSSMVSNRSVVLGGTVVPGKNGWVRAQVFVDGRDWVQGAMAAGGFARVRTFPDRRECAGELLAHEAAARMAKRGIWANKDFAVRTPETTASAKGSYQLVEGQVESTANIGGRVFLNFGPDFRTDFTVHVKPESVRLFAQSGVDLEALEGKRVRVRGFVRERNGPLIDASVPEQIELLR